jgi:hypothetical protein
MNKWRIYEIEVCRCPYYRPSEWINGFQQLYHLPTLLRRAAKGPGTVDLILFVVHLALDGHKAHLSLSLQVNMKWNGLKR